MKDFVYEGTSGLTDFSKQVEEILKKEAKRLEDQARVFLAQGYSLEELTITAYPCGKREVVLKSTLEQPS